MHRITSMDYYLEFVIDLVNYFRKNNNELLTYKLVSCQQWNVGLTALKSKLKMAFLAAEPSDRLMHYWKDLA